MNSYVFPEPPLIADLPRASVEQAEVLAERYLQALGISSVRLEIELHFRFVSVFRFVGFCAREGRNETGWVIGGSVPHLKLSDLEITTPIEALAIYSYFVRLWIDNKGLPQADGSVPEYRLPPSWELLLYEDFQASRLGIYTAYFGWHLVCENPTEVKHPDILDMCKRKGWIE